MTNTLKNNYWGSKKQFFLFAFILISVSISAHFPEKQQEIENEIAVWREVFNEVLSDSIVFSPKLHNNLNFINSKKIKPVLLF